MGLLLFCICFSTNNRVANVMISRNCNGVDICPTNVLGFTNCVCYVESKI